MNKSIVVILLFVLLPLVVNSQVDDSKLRVSSSSNGKEEAALYSKLLQDYYRQGEYELHKAYSDSLLLISELYDIKEMGILALNSQAIYYKNRSKRQKAIEIYHTALKKCDSVANNTGPKAMILVNMGNIYADIGSYEKSIETMDKLLEITDTIKSFSRIKAAALVGQSTNYLELQEYATSLEFAEKAVVLGTTMKDEEVLGTSYNNISDIYIKQKEYNKALSVTQKGFGLQEMKKRTKKRGMLLLNNGIANYHLSKQEIALASLREALEIGQDKEILELEMYSYEYLAKIFEEKKAFEKSYEAQKEYSRLRDIIKGDGKEAAIVDLEKEISETKNTLEVTEKRTAVITENTKQLMLYGSIIVVVLSTLLLFYMQRKKKVELENKDLRIQYASLKERIENTSYVVESNKEKEDQPYKNSSLTEADRQEYKELILQMMKNEKPYLEPDLSLGELASKLEMSTSHFSEVLHYCFKENFYNFINFYRITEAQELLKQTSYKEEKIITVAFDSGFKSKTTFNRVFKNYTGITPSEYRKT